MGFTARRLLALTGPLCGVPLSCHAERYWFLVDFARENSPAELRRLIREIRLRLLDEDEAAERQVRLYEGRWLTASRTFEGMVHVEGMFDPVAGAQILAALAAYMPGPDPDRLLGRTARQRRADAFADICAVALANTDRAEQGGEKPHVYVTVSWETLRRDLAAASECPDDETVDAAETDLADHHATKETSAADGDTKPASAAYGAGTSTSGGAEASAQSSDGVSTRDGASASDGAGAPTSGAANPGRVGGNPADAEVSSAEGTGADGDLQHDGPGASTGNGATEDADCAGTPGGWDGLTVLDWATQVGAAMDVDRLAEVLAGLHDQLRPGGPARLEPGGEPICAETARRLACDAGIIPVVLGSASEPLDIGRLSRLVPAGLRRAVDLRDQHCRFPGCDRPARWCECHHVWFWRDGGPTKLDNLVLLCRFHHVRVHDYGWLLTFNPATGEVRVARPDGTPYDIISQRDGPSP